MTAIFVQNGDALDYTPSDAKVDAGSPVLIGALLGFTKYEIPKGELGTVHISGVFSGVAKDTGALNAGQVVYWDKTNNKIQNSDADGYIPVGYAVKAAASADTTCTILLTPGANVATTTANEGSGSN